MNRIERKKLGTAASRIRKKLAAGAEVTSEESALLAKWDKLKSATGRKVETTPEAAPVAKPEAAPVAKPVAKPEASPVVKPEAVKAPPAPPPAIVRPPPDAPPRILGAGLSSKDWRSHWRVAGSDREATCVQAANAWEKLMLACIDKIEEYEGKPVVDRESLRKVFYPSVVLTVDALLPDAFEVRPEMVAAFGTSVTLGQRVMLGRSPRAKEIEDAKARKASPLDAKVVEFEAPKRVAPAPGEASPPPPPSPSVKPMPAISEAKSDPELLV